MLRLVIKEGRMSRVGKKPIEIPQNVEISVEKDNLVKVKGPKGELEQSIDSRFNLVTEDNVLTVERPDETKETRSLHGLYRTLIANMIEGVSNGYSKKLLITGSGYRAQKQGNNLVMNLGYSHQITIAEEDGITIDVPDNLTIVVNGIDKQKVGSVAANIRKCRLPEPYKGKGIRYEDEHIRRKEGKTGK